LRLSPGGGIPPDGPLFPSAQKNKKNKKLKISNSSLR
jgi:hypothetical protein